MTPDSEEFPPSYPPLPEPTYSAPTPRILQEHLKSQVLSQTIQSLAAADTMGPKRGSSNSARRGGRGGRRGTVSTQPPPPQSTANVPPAPRVLPVNRRLGYSPSNRTRPIYRRPQNASEEAQRIEALRNQLRHPYAVREDTLRFHLMREGWDINRAAASFRDDNSGNQLPHGHPQRTLRRGRTLESSRRRAIKDTAIGARGTDKSLAEQAAAAEKKPPPRMATSKSNIAQLYHQSAWDSGSAFPEIAQRAQHGIGFDDIVDRVTPMRPAPTGIAEKDERLAHFLTITGTQSWYSAKVFLEHFDWDVVAAIDEWVCDGSIPVVKPPSSTNRVGTDVSGYRGFNVNKPSLLHDPSAHKDLDFSEDEKDSDEDDDASAVIRQPTGAINFGDTPRTTDAAYEGEDRTRSGFVIDEDRAPARVHCPDASKLRIESIAGQRYKIKYFDGQIQEGGVDKDFRWEDGSDSGHSDEVEFDWADPKHIKRLNRWREEYFRRATGELVREEVVPFSKYELDWLREREAMRYEEEFYRIAGQDPNDSHHTDEEKWQKAVDAFSEGTHRMPFEMPDAELQQLTDDFNREFAGKRFYQKVNTWPDGTQTTSVKQFEKPRPTRTKGAIQTQRSRIATLCRHFLKIMNNPHGEARDPDSMVSDVDSDYAQSSEAEPDNEGDGSDAGHGTKRGHEDDSGEEDVASKKARLGGDDEEREEDEGLEEVDEEDVEDGAGSFFQEEDEEDEDLYGPG